MPRPNPPRSINVEGQLASRIAYERDQRGWTNDGLARRMADLGCPIQGSAIYKIEKSTPRRRVTVNELAAFALAFDTTVDDLVKPPEEHNLDAEARAVFRRYLAADADVATAHAGRNQAIRDVRAFLRQNSRARPAFESAVADYLQRTYNYTGDKPLEYMMRTFEDGYESTPVKTTIHGSQPRAKRPAKV
jgi:transcriptional regulator with XRE-family HTH domain